MPPCSWSETGENGYFAGLGAEAYKGADKEFSAEQGAVPANGAEPDAVTTSIGAESLGGSGKLWQLGTAVGLTVRPSGLGEVELTIAVPGCSWGSEEERDLDWEN